MLSALEKREMVLGEIVDTLGERLELEGPSAYFGVLSHTEDTFFGGKSVGELLLAGDFSDAYFLALEAPQIDLAYYDRMCELGSTEEEQVIIAENQGRRSAHIEVELMDLEIRDDPKPYLRLVR